MKVKTYLVWIFLILLTFGGLGCEDDSSDSSSDSTNVARDPGVTTGQDTITDYKGNVITVEVTLDSGKIPAVLTDGEVHGTLNLEYDFLTYQFVKVDTGQSTDLTMKVHIKYSQAPDTVLVYNSTTDSIAVLPFIDENGEVVIETETSNKFALVLEKEGTARGADATCDPDIENPDRFVVTSRTSATAVITLDPCLAEGATAFYKAWENNLHPGKERGVPKDATEVVGDFKNGNEVHLAGLSEGKRYRVYIKRKSVLKWKQDIYIPYAKPEDAQALAEKYNPIGVFHKDEDYFSSGCRGDS